jgi:hypothetical protein
MADDSTAIDLSIPSWFRHFIQQHKPPQLPILIANRIVKRMRPDIPPVPIQSHAGTRCPGTRHLKDPCSDSQPRIRRHDLHRRDPFCRFAALARGDVPLLGPRGVYRGDDLAGSVGKGLGGAEVRVEVPVALEDVEFIRGFVLVVATEGPGARVACRVLGGEVEGAEGDAEVEVGEDELDAFLWISFLGLHGGDMGKGSEK